MGVYWEDLGLGVQVVGVGHGEGDADNSESLVLVLDKLESFDIGPAGGREPDGCGIGYDGLD